MSGTPRYTPAEARRRAVLVLRGSRQALAGAPVPARIENALDRIDAVAADRWQREADAAGRLLDQARDQAATARAAEHAAERGERSAARQARRTAEAALRRAEQAARRYA